MLSRRGFGLVAGSSLVGIAGDAVEPAEAAASQWLSSGGTIPIGAPYTVQKSDKGKCLILMGGAYDTLTVPPPTAFESDFQVRLINGDVTKLAAKWIKGNGLDDFRLWPGQVCEIFNTGSHWAVSRPTRYKLPQDVFTVNTDFTAGADNEAEADGLVKPFKSVLHGLSCALNEFDLNATEGGRSRVSVKMAAGSTDTQLVHYSPHAQLGGYGGAAITVDMNGGTLGNGTGPCVQLYFGCVIQFRNGTFAGEVDLYWGAKCFMLDGITFGDPGKGFSHLCAIDYGTKCELLNDFRISGSGGRYHMVALDGGKIDAGAEITAVATQDLDFQATAFASDHGRISLAYLTWDSGGHTITGKRYNSQFGSIISGAHNLPGSEDGVAVTGLAY